MTAAIYFPRSSRFLLPAALSAILALGLYAVTIGGTYIYDDVAIVRDDARVHDPRLWRLIWTTDYFNGGPDNLYRPLASQSYALQWWLVGNRPWTFHLVNLLLGAGVCAIVAELARRLAGWKVGLIAGLLFAAHPVHAEVIAGIVGRADLMCAGAVFGSMVLYLHRPMTLARAMAIFSLTIVAMLSKEQGMLMPVLLLVLTPARRRLFPAPIDSTARTTAAGPLEHATPPAKGGERHAMQWLAVLQMFSVAGFIVLREQFLKLGFEWDRRYLDWSIQPMIRSVGIDRWLIPVMLLGRYVRLMAFPSRLSIDYGVGVIGWTLDHHDPYLYLGIAAIAGWLAAAIFCLARRAWVGLFCLLAAAITYSMVSNVIIIGAILNERLIFIPSAFLLILLAMGLARLNVRIWMPLFIVLLGLGCARTVTYAARWNDAGRFYETSLREQPDSIRLYTLVIQNDREHNQIDAARQAAAEACARFPDYSHLWEAAGLVEQDAQNWQQSLDYFLHARKLLMTVLLENKIIEIRKKVNAQAATTPGSTQP